MRRVPIAACSLLIAAAMLGACDGSRTGPQERPARAIRTTPAQTPARAHGRGARHGGPLALVTAETKNRLLIVDLRSGAVMRGIAVPAGPEYVASESGVAVVASSKAGALTLLDDAAFRRARVFRGFGTPRITEISPDGRHVYVIDDARGTVTVIGLSNRRVISTTYVGTGAHHATSSPDQRRLWVALGESARTIVIVDTSDLNHPRAVSRFDPGFPAHDLSFSPDGRRVWITSASGRAVAVFRASDHRLLFRVPGGAPPQHIAFDGAYAYLTSGYSATIEKVAASAGAVIKRTSVPYGSFELDAADGFVVTSSLFNGKLAIFTPQLELLRVITLAPATRDVAISYP